MGDGAYFLASLNDDESEDRKDSIFLSKVLDLAESFIFHWKMLSGSMSIGLLLYVSVRDIVSGTVMTSS